MGKFNSMRTFKSLHGWLGMLILPWIIMLGFTGFYLNHSKFVLSLLPSSSYDERQFDDWANPQAVDEREARNLAMRIFPLTHQRLSSTTRYHGRAVYMFKSDSGQVIVARDTGHYWVKTTFTRRTFDPMGRQLDKKIYWGRMFSRLHETGWINKSLGTWLVDIAAISLMIFGTTGLVLFLSPRFRRMKNRRARRAAA